jgi:protein kinase-like protein
MGDDVCGELVETIRGAIAPRWELKGSAGKGGQACAFLVTEAATGTRGVVKWLKPDQHPVALERFRREVQILTQIEHPNIVRLLDCSLDPPWYVTPAGEPLPRYWKARGPEQMTATDRFDAARRLVLPLVDAAAVFHRAGGIHRDIKPANVILLAGVPTLIDFGVAFRPDEDTDLTQLEPGRPVHTFFGSQAQFYSGWKASPAEDCLCLAWAWAWLLSDEEPLFGRYHWRHHRLIAHPDSQGVKALLAACTEGLVRDGGEMNDWITRLALRETTAAAALASGIDGDALRRESGAGMAERTLRQVESIERLRAMTELQSVFLSQLTDGIMTLDQEFQTARLPVRFRRVVHRSPDLGENMMAVARGGRALPLMEVTAGEGPRTFDIAISASHVEREDILPYHVQIQFGGQAAPRTGYLIFQLPDASFERTDEVDGTAMERGRRPVTIGDVIADIREHLNRKSIWRNIDVGEPPPTAAGR